MQTISRPKPSQNGNEPKRAGSGRGPKSFKDGKGPLASKNAAIGAAVLAAVLAGAVIVVFLNQYKESVNSDSVPVPVLVADQQIEIGASGDTIGEQNLFKATDVPKDQLKAGAITDAAILKGKIAATDILPGQQLTRADFKPAGNGVITKLASDQRAISVPLDRAHGLIGPLRVGDRVDVLSGFLVESGNGRPRPMLRTIAQDVLVLAVPPPVKSGGVGGRSNTTKEISLRVNNKAAPKIAFASEYGKVWLVLRPANGDDVDKRSLVTIETLMLSDLGNSPALQANRGGAARNAR